MKYGFPCGGYCPKGRIAEDGVIKEKYTLTETLSQNYNTRTLLNIMLSDATLVFYDKRPDKGSLNTINYAKQLNLKFYLFNFSLDPPLSECKNWLALNNIYVLNIAGPRESNSPGIYNKTMAVLKKILL